MPPQPQKLTPSYIEAKSIPEPNTGCWIWLGYLTPRGYGQIKLRGYPGMSAQRASYIAHNGSISDELDTDHTCRHPFCVNPQHLEAVTHQENCRRRTERKTHCASGHPYDSLDARGHKNCRVCDAQASMRYRRLAKSQEEG